jgi:hypothetical protein
MGFLRGVLAFISFPFSIFGFSVSTSFKLSFFSTTGFTFSSTGFSSSISEEEDFSDLSIYTSFITNSLSEPSSSSFWLMVFNAGGEVHLNGDCLKLDFSTLFKLFSL